jgi:hypothetical protein
MESSSKSRAIIPDRLWWPSPCRQEKVPGTTGNYAGVLGVIRTSTPSLGNPSTRVRLSIAVTPSRVWGVYSSPHTEQPCVRVGNHDCSGDYTGQNADKAMHYGPIILFPYWFYWTQFTLITIVSFAVFLPALLHLLTLRIIKTRVPYLPLASTAAESLTLLREHLRWWERQTCTY